MSGITNFAGYRFEKDITDIDEMRDFQSFKLNAVHFAAESHVKSLYRLWQPVHHLNVLGTQVLLEAARHRAWRSSM